MNIRKLGKWAKKHKRIIIRALRRSELLVEDSETKALYENVLKEMPIKTKEL
jgi:hypothetical protein